MTKLTATVEPWPEEDEEADDENNLTMFGGDTSNPTWDEYLSMFKPEWPERFEAVRECVEREGLTDTCADEFCNDNQFRISDGSRVSFSWRGWGDLLQAIAGKREGYMRYYMREIREMDES